MRDHLQQQKVGAEENRLAQEAEKALLEQVSVELPPKLLADMEENASEEVGDESRQQQQDTLKRFLILDAIATKNDIQANQQDFYQQLQIAAAVRRKIDEIYKDLQSQVAYNGF